MATRNILNVTLSGQTGTGSFVGSTSPTLVTPVLGVPSATSLAFSSTSGVIGTATNDNAAAGSVGEIISSSIPYATPVNITTSTVSQTMTSISLTAGDWDVWGNVVYVPAAGTTFIQFAGGISLVNNTLPETSLIYIMQNSTFSASNANGFVAPQQRISISGTTTVYLIVYAGFAVSTVGASGSLFARRAR